MLVFIDESGDPGLKLSQGSSQYFTVALTVFEDHEEAAACDKRIELLKRELGWGALDEFHFKNNSDRVREAFLRAVAPYNFFYYGIVMNKAYLWGDGFKGKKSFYKYSCGLVFENAKEKLNGAVVVIDESGNADFRKQLQKYLKKRVNDGVQKVVKKVKMERSVSNNLLQLADFVAGSVNRSILGKRKQSDKYRDMISHREIYVQIWPKVHNT